VALIETRKYGRSIERQRALQDSNLFGLTLSGVLAGTLSGVLAGTLTCVLSGIS
jgi:hypothetical protein